jgi:uroporphyrinogen III methyltransferase/synthase
MTLRGADLLRRASVVVYDHLANEAILQMAPQAEWIFVGKRADQHAMVQKDINQLLVDLSKKHDAVVRLKGGDPFVFGRGGEEANALQKEGISFEVVPGITAGIAAPAYAGIPVTHRSHSSSVTFLTGHYEQADELDLDKIHLTGTFAFYMGLKYLEQNLQKFIALGRAPHTPAAAIMWGTRSKQKVVEGTLDSLAKKVEEAQLTTPCMVIVGEVVDLRQTMQWFEERPLFGKRVVVTQSRKGASSLTKLLQEQGADVLECPTVELTPNENSLPDLDLHTYDWIVCMSVNSVDALTQRMAEQGMDGRDLHGVKLCAVSKKTAEALNDKFLNVDLIPDRYEPAVVADLLEETGGGLKGQRILLPRADIGRSALPGVLQDRGAKVDEWQAYALSDVPQQAEWVSALMAYEPDVIIFGSASGARNFRQWLNEEQLAQLKAQCRFAALGPTASREANDLGMPVSIEPAVHRIPNLVEAIAESCRKANS